MAARGISAADVADVFADFIVRHEPLATARPTATISAARVIIRIHDERQTGARLGFHHKAGRLKRDGVDFHFLTTDGHGWTRIKTNFLAVPKSAVNPFARLLNKSSGGCGTLAFSGADYRRWKVFPAYFYVAFLSGFHIRVYLCSSVVN
jgi:hypothetical protein